MDVWIFPDLNDHQKVYNALKKFGAPLQDMTPEDFKERKMIYQIGVAPIRIDIKMDVEGLDFKKAWKNRKKVLYGKTAGSFTSKINLSHCRSIFEKVVSTDVTIIKQVRGLFFWILEEKKPSLHSSPIF
jgi:hypothetical protein